MTKTMDHLLLLRIVRVIVFTSLFLQHKKVSLLHKNNKVREREQGKKYNKK